MFDEIRVLLMFGEGGVSAMGIRTGFEDLEGTEMDGKEDDVDELVLVE